MENVENSFKTQAKRRKINTSPRGKLTFLFGKKSKQKKTMHFTFRKETRAQENHALFFFLERKVSRRKPCIMRFRKKLGQKENYALLFFLERKVSKRKPCIMRFGRKLGHRKTMPSFSFWKEKQAKENRAFCVSEGNRGTGKPCFLLLEKTQSKENHTILLWKTP